MNTCPDCPNDLVCHDQGECLRPTPETDAEELHEPYLVNELPFCVVRIDFARRLERERNEARELLASEKSTRNAIIAKGIETERQFAEAREENARLREWHGLTDAGLRLRLGELTAQEIRTVRAVLNAIVADETTN